MKAVVITEPGGPEKLQIEEREIPLPGINEVLIQVKAAGVNRPDIAQRLGIYPAPAGVPADIPGLEVSGIIHAMGEGVKTHEIGDEICALVAGGGYAEYVTAPEEQCLTLPEDVGIEEAAALPETFFTVWNNVFDIGKFKEGDKVLVHGGSSGIGVATIQMVKALGGMVLVTAGTDEKCDFCKSLGADFAVNYKTRDFEVEIKNKLGGDGVNIVLDMVGGDYSEKNIRLMAKKGRLVMINAMKGKMGVVDLLRVMTHQLVITGSTLRPQSPAYKGNIAKNLMTEIWPFFPEKIKPIIHTTFPLHQANKAHQLMESSAHTGKILLLI
ncbi:MAG: NAD(P)H-quinone oxidoreductase [Cyclobacteriaceae bacterium]